MNLSIERAKLFLKKERKKISITCQATAIIMIILFRTNNMWERTVCGHSLQELRSETKSKY